LSYVLSRVTSVLPRKILSQTVVVYTNCRSDAQRNFCHEDLAKYFVDSIPPERVLHIDNPFALMNNLSKPKVQNNPKELKKLKRDRMP